ncbi:hypothetical protein MTR67_024547, partial [Solanum verrucosum]
PQRGIQSIEEKNFCPAQPSVFFECNYNFQISPIWHIDLLSTLSLQNR